MPWPAPHAHNVGRVSRRVAWFLIALCLWTLWVWGTRMWIISHQHQTFAFKAVHDTLGVISIAFGLGAGWIGLRALRKPKTPAQPPEPSRMGR
jgi:hypothetical protein